MDNPPGATPLRVAYFFSRFPHPTETFLQREVRAMRRPGVELELWSWHGGQAGFEGQRVRQFSKWSLLTLAWRIVLEWWRGPEAVSDLARRLFRTWPRDWLNYWENLYGAGIAVVMAHHFRRHRVDHIHAVWCSLPAMVAWGVSRMAGIPFSVGAHAYDLYEHGGDWLLREKCAAARFVHTSTAAGRRRLVSLGVEEGKVLLVRRGLNNLPPLRALRRPRRPLRVLCVARLVPKKGLSHQVRIYAACRAAGLEFHVRIVGEGPLAARLQSELRSAGLTASVELAGALPEEEVWKAMAAADVLVHTGVVDASGDRDGLPNVVPEAMAAGAVVLTAPAAGVLEAVEAGATGLVLPLHQPAAWVEALSRVQRDDALVEHLRAGARRWVEAEFDASANAARLLSRFRSALPQ